MNLFLFIIAQIVPWYLFPGTQSQTKAETEQKTVRDSVVVAAAAVSEEIEEELSADTLFVADIPEEINISLILPFNASSETNGGMSDFYMGALLAARSLGQEGIRLCLRPFDISAAVPDSALLSQSDIIIGPVSASDITKISSICPREKHIISPLDHSVNGMLDSLAVVQVPPSQMALTDSLSAWLESELNGPERTVVLKSGVNLNDLEKDCSLDTTTRFIVESADDRFISEAVRHVSVLSMLRHKVALYAPSRLRNIDNVNVELLHESSTRIVSSYNVDYTDPSVKSFIYSYRALFDAEPGQFAFHGYDTVRYFTHLCARFGRKWYDKMEEYSEKGLQMTFRFVPSGCGKVNSGVRRSVYNKDFSVSCE